VLAVRRTAKLNVEDPQPASVPAISKSIQVTCSHSRNLL
jgi:hypothetical protein